MFANKPELEISETLLIAVAGIAVVLLELALLSVLIIFLSKILRAIEGKFVSKPDEPVEAAAQAAVSVAAPAAPVAAAAGLQLIDIDEPTAAVVMAIVSNSSGIPLEKLSFKSIKPAEGVQLIDVDDPTAAAIMAIVSNESGIPLERLSFKSIKKVEE